MGRQRPGGMWDAASPYLPVVVTGGSGRHWRTYWTGIKET